MINFMKCKRTRRQHIWDCNMRSFPRRMQHLVQAGLFCVLVKLSHCFTLIQFIYWICSCLKMSPSFHVSLTSPEGQGQVQTGSWTGKWREKLNRLNRNVFMCESWATGTSRSSCGYARAVGVSLCRKWYHCSTDSHRLHHFKERLRTTTDCIWLHCPFSFCSPRFSSLSFSVLVLCCWAPFSSVWLSRICWLAGFFLWQRWRINFIDLL